MENRFHIGFTNCMVYQLNINDTPAAYFPKKNDKEFPMQSKDAFSYCNKKDGENAVTWFFY